MKSLLPSLKEKKRYLTFKVISDKKFNFKDIEKTISLNNIEFNGVLNSSKTNINFIQDCFNFENQTGIIKVNNKYIDNTKASLTLIKYINSSSVIIRSLYVSGILNKAKRYLGG